MKDNRLGTLITLSDIWREYQAIRKLQPETLRNYRICIETNLCGWLDLPIHLISSDMVIKLHRSLSETSPAQANSSMRVLKSLMNFADRRHESLTECCAVRNPVKILNEERCWNRVPPRRRIITAEQLPNWFATLRELADTKSRDFHAFLLLTGLRKMEAARLEWSAVDFAVGEIRIAKTKIGLNHALPMTMQTRALLQHRHDAARSRYVFPGYRSSGTALAVDDPKTHLSEDWRGYELVEKLSGIPFHFHDLRRTFSSTADDLEISEAVISRILNHASTSVTRDYMVATSQRFRRVMQQINDEIILRSGLYDISALWTPDSDRDSNVVAWRTRA